jgi:outer membrane protein OmpA-like peptidoglycan-associated protein
MRTSSAVALLMGLALAGPASGQHPPVTEAHALAYIHSAFVTQADPGVMAPRVALAPELEKRFGLATGSDGPKVYRALIEAAGDNPVDVRRAAPAELAAYGMRRGLDPSAPHPLYTVEAGRQKFLVQYDLRKLGIPFVGQLGVPDPEPRIVAKVEPPKANATPVNLTWTGLFEFDSAMLTDAARARLDAEIAPRLAELDLRRIEVQAHADQLGSDEYNQQLSERRAEAVRDYLAARGIDPARIELIGYGKALPVKACPGEKALAALIDCLAPNRRVVIELQGLSRSPVLEARQR